MTCPRGGGGGRGAGEHCAFIRYGCRVCVCVCVEQYISLDTISYFIPRTARGTTEREEKKGKTRSDGERGGEIRRVNYYLYSQIFARGGGPAHAVLVYYVPIHNIQIVRRHDSKIVFIATNNINNGNVVYILKSIYYYVCIYTLKGGFLK